MVLQGVCCKDGLTRSMLQKCDKYDGPWPCSLDGVKWLKVWIPQH